MGRVGAGQISVRRDMADEAAGKMEAIASSVTQACSSIRVTPLDISSGKAADSIVELGGKLKEVGDSLVELCQRSADSVRNAASAYEDTDTLVAQIIWGSDEG